MPEDIEQSQTVGAVPATVRV